MALLKSIDVAGTGAPALYWRFERLTVDASGTPIGEALGSALVIVRMVGYVTKAAREAGLNPVGGAVRVFRFLLSDIGALTLPNIYTAVRAQAEFADATEDP